MTGVQTCALPIFAFFLFTAAIYLAYTSLSLWALRAVSRRYSLGTDRVQLL